MFWGLRGQFLRHWLQRCATKSRMRSCSRRGGTCLHAGILENCASSVLSKGFASLCMSSWFFCDMSLNLYLMPGYFMHGALMRVCCHVVHF